MRVGLVVLISLSAGLAARGRGTGAARAVAEAVLPRASATPLVVVTACSQSAYRVGYSRPSFITRDLKGLLTWQVLHMTIGGAAAGDCDTDGDIDLFITYGNTGGANG